MKNSIFIGIILLGLQLGCSKSSSSSSSNFIGSIPALAPIVDSAAPKGLKASSTSAEILFQKFHWASIFGITVARAAVTASNVVTQLSGIFKGTYGKISGGTATGYINALLEDLDSRITELKTRFPDKTPTCVKATPQEYVVDASTVDEAFKLSLDVQCSDAFSGDQSASGSGMVFGKNTAGDYSLWLGLNHSTTSGFGYAAKVKSPESESDKEVDMLFVEGEAQYGRGSIAHLKAKPGSKTYELVFVSNTASGISPVSGGSSSTTGCGLNLISDGTLIYVKGKYLESGSSCAAATAFETCLSATDLSENATSGACTALKASFTISSNLDGIAYTDVPTPSASELRLFNVIQTGNASSLASQVALPAE